MLLHLLLVMHVFSRVAGPAIILSQQNQTLLEKAKTWSVVVEPLDSVAVRVWAYYGGGKQTIGRMAYI